MVKREIIAAVFLYLACCCASPPSPHLIFIVADDLGWNDVGYHNLDIISPTIDHLAETGIKLNQSYVQPLCSPSRTAFMTGVYPFRLGLQHLIITPQQDVCVPLNRTFFPQVLKAHGYRTHMIGKWHLGFCKWECTPTSRGFDSFYGFYTGGEDYYSHVSRNGYDYRFNATVNKASSGNYSTYEFAARAEDIITNHDADKPLYIYLPFQSVHMPLQVPDRYLEMYKDIGDKNRKALSAMVTALDDAIGRVVRALQDKGMYDDSIIVFTSDNGGLTTAGGNNSPLRGGKLSIFEGGTRVPAFVHSPLLNQTGVTHTGMMHAVDWFPTLASALGIPYNASLQDQDGVDQWEAITSLGASKRSEFVYNMDYSPLPLQGQSAIRVGDYKLIQGYPGIYQGWYKPADVDQGPQISLSTANMNNISIARPQNKQEQLLFASLYNYLFNLREDPTEHDNLYDKMPDVARKLQASLEQQRQRYVTPNFPANNPKSNPKNFNGVWSPGWC